jgi:sialidase-1
MIRFPGSAFFLLCLGAGASARYAQSGETGHAPLLPQMVIDEIRPTAAYPRNSEGAFIGLRDGRILFAYSRFTGGGGDDEAAEIAARTSADRGRTWSEDFLLVARGTAMNVMSVSFLRLGDGRIAMFYLRKSAKTDSRPYVTFSSDEAKTWTEARLCIQQPGYYVLNNDRVIQLRSGRILMPVALHTGPDGKFNSRGKVMVYLSDDEGVSWRRSRNVLEFPGPSRGGLQEPGVVELKNGRVLMFMRTMVGVQYLSESRDGGQSWSPARPSKIPSPLSPASMKRIPATGDLLMVWNDHSHVDPSIRAAEQGSHVTGGKRTPLTAAISRNEGRNWILRHDIEDAPDGWYCYTAIYFDRDRVLLGFSSGGRGLALLSKLDLVSFPISALYAKPAGK